MADKLDVTRLHALRPEQAAAIKAAALGTGSAMPGAAVAMGVAPAPRAATKPGKERWPVKTGTDRDIDSVNESGFVDTTVEELIALPRPSDMLPATQEFSHYQDQRAEPTETTIWRITADITALKMEADGDYHLVLQGESGSTMVGEVPTPGPPFVAETSPFSDAIRTARAAVDEHLVKHLNPAEFVQMGGMLVPRAAVPGAPPPPPAAPGAPPRTFLPPAGGGGAAMPAFKTKVRARATISGVGFFDRVHGQTGVAESGIELHPILDIQFE